MANPYINVYMGNPTAGATDGTAVSTDGAFTAPISFRLNLEKNESKILKCAVRTKAGSLACNVTIKFTNDIGAHFKLCKVENGVFGDEITFNRVIDTNSIFYVKASSSDTENPRTDKSVGLQITCDKY